jgi:hypothetical protein
MSALQFAIVGFFRRLLMAGFPTCAEEAQNAHRFQVHARE